MPWDVRAAVLAAVTGFLLAAGSTSVIAAELRVSGGTTVGRGIVIANQAAIEQETGLTLKVAVNGDGNGLLDLYGGRCDVAMIAVPLQATEQMVNREKPGSLSIADFQVARVGKSTTRFVVNPANPVRSLSAAQLRDIFTGKIASWKEVGGNDSPIVVVAEAPGRGSRTNVVVNFLNGADITPSARTVQALVQVIQVVEQLPNAISYGNVTTITPKVAVLPDVEIEQTLGLVTKGPPNADAQKLIAAVAKYGADFK